MERDVRNFVKNCNICQQFKYDNASSPGLLQPFPIPNKVWSDVSMDFIKGLPNSKGYIVIIVAVDRLSKYAHFLSFSHLHFALSIA